MSKKAKAAAKEARLKKKRALKASMKARYESYRDSGTNSKRKRLKAAKDRILRAFRTPVRHRSRGRAGTLTLSQFTRLYV